MNAAVLIRSNLNLRLEHGLQTAMGRQRQTRPQFRSNAYGMARHGRSSSFAADTRVARGFRSVFVLKGIGVACIVGARCFGTLAPERFESGVRLAPVIFLGEPILAEDTSNKRLPDALTRHNRNLLPSACPS